MIFKHHQGLRSGWLLLMLCWLAPLPVSAAEPAGKVIIAAGDAYALDENGLRRTLRRRAEFHVGDTLGTGADGQLQVRFKDGALMALRENSELHIDAYRFGAADGAEDRSMSTLIKGGFRTITGLIGKQDPEAYRVTTPVATIGIRGTNYEAVLGDGLVVGVWKGGVQVRNDAGVLDIGQGAAFNFARVSDARQVPSGVLAAPALLQGRLPPPAPQQGQAEKEDADSSGGGQTAVATDTTGSAEVAGADTAVEDGTTGELAAAEPTADTDSGGMLTDSTSSSGEVAVIGTATDTLAEPSFVPDPTPSSISDQFLLDARLSDLEKQRLTDDKRIGIMILSGPVPKNFPNDVGALSGGRATAADLGPVITTSEVDPATGSFDQFVNGAVKGVYRPGTVSQLPPPSPVPASPGYGMEWGAWDAVATNPLAVQTDATDASVVSYLDRPVFWATLPPADKAGLDARTGSAVFSNVVAAFGHASSYGGGSAILTSDFRFTAAIDFNTGAISAGQITVGASPSTLPEQWTVNFTGQLNGPLLNIEPQNISGTVTSSFGTQAVDAEIGALLTGAGANALGGGFAFTSRQDGNIHAEGLFLVTE